jgi:hypothetical protein
MANLWEQWEIDILQQYYATAAPEDLLDWLPGRSWSGIVCKATASLGLQRERRAHKWSAEQDAWLLDNYESSTWEELFAQFPFSTRGNLIQRASLLRTGKLKVSNSRRLAEEARRARDAEAMAWHRRLCAYYFGDDQEETGS